MPWMRAAAPSDSGRVWFSFSRISVDRPPISSNVIPCQVHAVLPPAQANLGLLPMQIAGVARIGAKLLRGPFRQVPKPGKCVAQQWPCDRIVARQVQHRPPPPIGGGDDPQPVHRRGGQSFLARALHRISQRGLVCA